ncbi:MAG: leucine-rich repeat protein, partial [Clostridiales Family XIII bacterium]|nr:leucine-rich repeat protein [Clostridiales Family XIII bacterium]
MSAKNTLHSITASRLVALLLCAALVFTTVVTAGTQSAYAEEASTGTGSSESTGSEEGDRTTAIEVPVAFVEEGADTDASGGASGATTGEASDGATETPANDPAGEAAEPSGEASGEAQEQADTPAGKESRSSIAPQEVAPLDSIFAGVNTPASDFSFKPLNGTYALLEGYSGSDTVIVLPTHSSDGHIVQEIEAGAFQSNTSLQAVLISDTIEIIGNNAFSGLSALTQIGFGNCSDDTVIGTSAFQNCTGLTAITIPGTVTSIGSQAFRGCTGLTSVTLGEGLLTLSSQAFQGCTALAEIHLPDSLQTTGYGVFAGCTNLEDVNYPAGWATASSTSMSGGNYAIFGGTKVKSIEVPEGVTAIPAYAFAGCATLEQVALPASLEGIGNYAFYGCTGLEEMDVPSGVAAIGNYAFSDCTGLGAVTLAEGLESIGSGAFSGCTG